jgi:hypothetical protein
MRSSQLPKQRSAQLPKRSNFNHFFVDKLIICIIFVKKKVEKVEEVEEVYI